MKPGKVCRLDIACAVLHNIAIKRNEPLVENDQDDHHDDQPQFHLLMDNRMDGEYVLTLLNPFLLKNHV
jgi:hypothetical protein